METREGWHGLIRVPYQKVNRAPVFSAPWCKERDNRMLAGSLRERYATPGPHTAAHWGAELSEGYQATRGSVWVSGFFR